MSTEIDQSAAPYFNDYAANADYYAVMFKPGFAVQTRELNVLQSMLQSQIERFGDQIFKKGTILDGCNFIFHNNYQYVKIKDIDTKGLATVPSLYMGMFVRGAVGNVTGYIVNYADGFEAASPDTKTLYINYTNSGTSLNTYSFAADETLTVYDPQNSLYKVTVDNGGLNFSNNDAVVILPAIAVRMDANASFTAGEYIGVPATGANVQIVSVDTTTLASKGHVVLTVKPRGADLANASANSSMWSLFVADEIINASNTTSATVQSLIGSSATAKVVTSPVGKVTGIRLLTRGENYQVPPYVSIQSANNLSGITALALTAENYLTQVKVLNTANSVGSGYAFSINEGHIYQKGYFLRVAGQTVIVSKYSPSPNNVAVGFRTVESIIDSNTDQSLLDNALGAPNETAPGADRLQLKPVLDVSDITAANANDEFFAICEWSDGQPYKQNQYTQYSKIGDEMAQRAFDESGNFVIDTFQVGTKSTANTQNEAKYYTAVIDPGQAYISGHKVQTLRNYYIDVEKGIDTKVANSYISFNYGNYIRIKEVGGLFQFSTGDTVSFYDAASTYITRFKSNTSIALTPLGNAIGTARIRSMILESGIAGDASATYRLYLFDINMNAGKNFANVRSVAYLGTNPGIADIIVELDPTTSANVAMVRGTSNTGLIFPAGVESLKASSNTTYLYRTIDQTTTFANTGILVKSIAATPNEFYPAVGNLSSSDLMTLQVIPLGNTLFQYDNTRGVITSVVGNNVVVGTANSNMVEDYAAGDYVNLYHLSNTSLSLITSVKDVINTTALTLGTNATFANTDLRMRRVFPKNMTIPFGMRAGLIGNVGSNSNILTLTMNHANGTALTLAGTVSVNTAVAVNIERRGVSSTAKTATRQRFVKINCANNSDGAAGPWCLGVPDVFRLRNVYISSNISTINVASSKVTSEFHIDHNQTQHYLGLSYLYKKPRSSLNITSASALLVEFDYNVRADDGYFDTVSYLGTSNSQQIFVHDSLPLANLTTFSNSLEVPEINTPSGQYFDLLNCLDFRPAVNATATPSLTVAGAPINPGETVSFGNTADPANDKKFPVPDASAKSRIEYYLGRMDTAFVSGPEGVIAISKGIPDADPRRRLEANHPKDSLKLQTLTVPAYPNITDVISRNVSEIINTSMSNERNTNIRLKSRVISPLLTSYEFQLSQPMVYTMEDIGSLERRIKDLEYYQSLSILETSITNKTIPSSIDGSLNRFKFGFFADDFSTEVYSDVDNPQYAASIEMEGPYDYGTSKSPMETDNNWAQSDKNVPTSTVLTPNKLIQKKTNRLVPPKFVWSLSHYCENSDYLDVLGISQLNATLPATPPVDPIDPNPPCIPKVTNNTSTGNTVIIPQYEAVIHQGTYYSGATNNFWWGPPPPVVIDNKQIVVNGTGKMKVLIYGNPRVGKGASLKLKQGANTIVTTSILNAAGGFSAPSNTVATVLLNNPQLEPFWNVMVDTPWTPAWGDEFNPATIIKQPITADGTLTRGFGYAEFDHDPTKGNTYTIEFVSGPETTHSTESRYAVVYPSTPITTSNSTGQVTTVVDPCRPVEATLYIGTINVGPNILSWACSKSFVVNNIRRAGTIFSATGLKPGTLHRFYVDGVDQTQWTLHFTGDNSQVKSTFDDTGLLVNASGKLAFAYYLPLDDSNIAWLDAIVANYQKNSWGSSGYSTFALKAPGSSATKLVAKRNSEKPLPTNPAGTP